MIVYGRNPVREAIRGPRTVHRVWATKNATREPWLAEGGVPVVVSGAEDIEQARAPDARFDHLGCERNARQEPGESASGRRRIHLLLLLDVLLYGDDH